MDMEGPRRTAPEPLFSRLPVGAERAVYAYADDPTGRTASGVAFASATSDPFFSPRLVEVVPAPLDRPDLIGPLRVEYSLDAELTQSVFRILRAGRVERGHVIVLDPNTGRVLAYASTAPEVFPPTRAYPAASLIKIVTANALLDTPRGQIDKPCRYRGNPYRFTNSRVNRPKTGREVSLEMAIATSNNRCFAQFAVNDVGGLGLLDAIDKFGWLSQSGPGHDAGAVSLGGDDYELGRLGCGLAGCRITPLHAARLAATLADGINVEPWWVDRVVDAEGHELARPESAAARRVMSSARADQLRQMMVRTTTRGTARSAFRNRRGRPLLDSVEVAGKTGNLSGKDPKGRYEWFIGLAPVDDPSIAIAVVQVHGHLWWKKSSEIAASVLSEVFCEKSRCASALASRFTGRLGAQAAPVFLSESGRSEPDD
jgi:cell division protein FtsI/penicillin-binding protein 2